MSPIAAFCGSFNSTSSSNSGSKKQARPRKARMLAPIEIALDDAKRRAASGDWDGAHGSTFVGLYALCHQMIYSVVPEELFAIAEYRTAAKMAAKMLHENFGDDPFRLAEFIRWSWEREKRKHNWALANGADRKRLGVRWQFSLGILTDYRIALSQKKR